MDRARKNCCTFMADDGALTRCVAGQVDPEKHPDLTAAWDEAAVMDSMQGTRPHRRRGAAGSLGSSGIVPEVPAPPGRQGRPSFMGDDGDIKGTAGSRHKTRGTLKSRVCSLHLCFQIWVLHDKKRFPFTESWTQRCFNQFYLDLQHLNCVIYMAF